MFGPIAPRTRRFDQRRTLPVPGSLAAARTAGATVEGLARRRKNPEASAPARQIRERRIRSQSLESEMAVVGSSVNLWDHATSGRHTS